MSLPKLRGYATLVHNDQEFPQRIRLRNGILAGKSHREELFRILSWSTILQFNVSVLDIDRNRIVLAYGTDEEKILQFQSLYEARKWYAAIEKSSNWELSSYFTLNNIIGTGAYGTVFSAIEVSTGQQVAVKCMARQGNDSLHNQLHMAEVRAMTTLGHPNVIQAFDVLEGVETLYIVMPRMEGTLRDVLESHFSLTDDQARGVMNQILKGLSSLHEKGVAHCDLKLDNILVDRLQFPINVRIADFGNASFVKQDGMLHASVNAKGTAFYKAPEMQLEEPCTTKIDVWACGVMFHEMMTGRQAPFGVLNTNDEPQILVDSIDVQDDEWMGVSDEAKDFLWCLLDSNPSSRFSPEEGLEHDWIKL